MRLHAPINPKIIPIIFIKLIFSLINNAEITITRIGLVVIIIAALMGVVRFKPSKKNNWFIATPKRPHKANRGRSELLTLSLIKILKNKKKRDTPPKTLSKINPEGLIYSGITSLAIE